MKGGPVSSVVNQIYSAESSICGDRPEENEMSDDDYNNSITFTDDDNLETRVSDMDTMLDDYQPIIPESDEPLIPQELPFAPGEGQIPVSMFKDENVEYLAFPTIFVHKRGQIIVIEFIKFITMTYASIVI